jgi:diguanylate cyclase (GGDEF)-like protein
MKMQTRPEGAFAVSFLLRFLSHYEASLIIVRFFLATLLPLFAWQPLLMTYDVVLLAGFGYYLLTTLILIALFERTERRFRIWNLIMILDLPIVSALVWSQGGIATDLYYYYFLTMTMGAFLHNWSRSVRIALLTNVCYGVTLFLAPGTAELRDIVLRLALFLATSMAFPLLSLIEDLRKNESSQLLKEKEQLLSEMESINRQVAEYAFDLHALAVTDQLTKLHNHTYFHSRIIIEVEKSKQTGKAVSLILLDIDNFKRVNDTYGHLIGDEVLVAISKRIAELLRGTYHVPCRAGGEELAVLMPDTDLDEAYDFADYLRREIAKVAVPLPNQEHLCVSVSVGVASFPSQCDNHQQLIDCADQAMYIAKSTGKNRTCRYNPSLAEIVG